MRHDNVAAARELLEDGEFGDGGALRADDPSLEAGVYASFVGIVLLTEPTRAVVRRDKGLNGNLKWHVDDLIRLMPVAWKYDTADQAAKCIRATCVRNGIVVNGYREIKARDAAGTVHIFRTRPPKILTTIHTILARRIVEAPIRPMFPALHKKTSVSESLVRQCLVLPYEERRWLADVVWRGAGMEGCPLDAARLITEIRKLSPAHREELRLMLW